jgi:rhodanese-related sulfurtransferase
MKNIQFSIIAILILVLGCQSKKTEQQTEDVVQEHPEVIAEEGLSVISAEELKKLMDNEQELILLDVRRPDEIANGTIPGSKEYAEYGAESFEESLAKLDKDKTYYVYCHAGKRAGNTQQIMMDMGFKNVINIDGGISGWVEAGYEVEVQ